MKNFLQIQRLLTIIALCIFLYSCQEKEKTDPQPDLAGTVSGIYKFSELAGEGEVYPADQTNLKGDVRLVRRSASIVDAEVDIRLKTTDDEYMVEDFADLQLAETDGAIDVIHQGKKVAKINGDKIVIFAKDEEGVSFTITCAK